VIRADAACVSPAGGVSTCVATYLARARGSGEPENSKIRTRLLEHFMRDCENLARDEGWHVGVRTAPAPAFSLSERRPLTRLFIFGGVGLMQKLNEDGEHIRDQFDDKLENFRRRLEDILGNNPDNSMP
jgi:hypothetical protein